jgi:acetyl-CoA carboxylase biotin carboxyl carrier protein
MPLSDDDVREILRLIDETDVEELRIETEAFSLYVTRGAAAHGPPPTPTDAAPAVEARADGVASDELVTISAPMLGTFYRAEAPGAAPFVDVGARVEPDTVVCLIEVMKMMNPVPAGVAGTIVEVYADNAQLVEYGTALFQVEPE